MLTVVPIGIWEIIESFTVDDQERFLRFVTSCSRQPLLGFGQLHPKFAIQKIPLHVPEYPNTERLPCAATCANTLKLPEYPTTAMLREKLLYAIRDESGFQLS